MSRANSNTTDPPRSLRSLIALSGIAPFQLETSGDVVLSSLTDDSRRVSPGGCFVAVRGKGSDGHDYVTQAVRAGAAVIVVDREVTVPPGVVCVRVSDTRAALARLASAFHGLSNEFGNSLRLIGVTGTNGKTTVTWLLRSILQAAGHSCALIGTVEVDLCERRFAASMTTPGPIELCENLSAARRSGANWAVLEVSSHALDQHRCDGLVFDAGVFTNLTGDHLDYHGSMEEYGRAKRRLFEELSPRASAVINADDPLGSHMASATRANVTTYGLDAPDADVRGVIRRMDATGCDFEIRVRGRSIDLRVQLLGRYNVLNALAAFAAARQLGVSEEAVVTGLERIEGVPGRLQRAEPPGRPVPVLVDYAHTDDALRNVLNALRPLTSGRLICVFGCGGDRDRSKRPRMGAVAASIADVVIVTSDNPRTEDPRGIIDEILTGVAARTSCRIMVEPDRRSAIEAAVSEARPGDTVLIAGKGHEDYQIVGDRVLPFDDVSAARSCLESRMFAKEAVA